MHASTNNRIRDTIIGLALLVVMALPLSAWKDEELFYTSVAPNIVVLMDTSGSMRNVIFHPDYAPGAANYGSFSPKIAAEMEGWQEQYLRQNRWVARWCTGSAATLYSTTANHSSVKINSKSYRVTSSTLSSTTTSGGYLWYQVQSDRYARFPAGAEVIIASYNGTSGNSTSATYYQDALATVAELKQIGANWYVRFSGIVGGPISTNTSSSNLCMQYIYNNTPAIDRKIINLYGGNDPISLASGTTSETVYTQTGNGVSQNDYLAWLFNTASDEQRAQVTWFADHGTFDTSDSNDYREDRTTRMRVARAALKDIIGQFEAKNQKLRMGLFRLNGGDGSRIGTYSSLNGRVKDMTVETNRDNLKTIITNQNPETSTPLGEALYEVWRYYRGDYRNTPQYSEDTWELGMYCRSSFCILLTDGMPNSESTRYYTSGDSGIPLAHDDATYKTDVFDNSVINVAYHLATNDARPAMQDPQSVYTYTIGFTTSGTANTVLTQTAVNGKGQFFAANNYDELLAVFDTIIGAIAEQTTNFAAFTAPKLTAIGDNYQGYVASFIPRKASAMWEGDVRCYGLDANGDFLLNPNGTLKSPLWEASDKLSAGDPGSRDIFTFFSGSMQDFKSANTDITNTMLGLGVGAAEDAKRHRIITIVRGEEDASAGITYPYIRAGTEGALKTGPSRLGDVFHFQPLVVGEPVKWRIAFDNSFKAFYEANKNRKKAVYVGANDGMLHCFNVVDGSEIWAFLPPVNLKKIKALGLEEQHEYYVDGQAAAQEMKINNNTDASAWRTILVFGLGRGGPGYYALDVSNPETKQFRWEISVPVNGANAGKTVLTQADGTQTVISDFPWLGHTMGTPVFGNIANGDSSIPIVALTGGYEEDYLDGAASKVGKAAFILNAWTGEVIRWFSYGADANSATHQTSSDLKFSLAASPLLVTFKTTTYAKPQISEYLYLADIGGNIWKVDIRSANKSDWLLEKIFNTQGSLVKSGLSSRPFFIAPTIGYDDNYHIWVMAGTGNRASPNDQQCQGYFFNFIDDDNHPSGGYTASDLQYMPDLFTDTSIYDYDGDGWSDAEETAAGKDTKDKDDHPDTDPSTVTHKNITDPQGFYFNMTLGAGSGFTGEKLFEPVPIYFSHMVVFNTYTPATVAGSDETCEPMGSMRLYRYRLTGLAGGSAKIDALEGTNARILGSGIYQTSTHSAYKIYTGDPKPGGELIGQSQELSLPDIFGPSFWLEKK